MISGPLSSLSSLLSDHLCGKHDSMSGTYILLTFYVFYLTVVTTDICGPMLNFLVLYLGFHDICERFVIHSDNKFSHSNTDLISVEHKR